jgi:hypothetical protein
MEATVEEFCLSGSSDSEGEAQAPEHSINVLARAQVLEATACTRPCVASNR